MATIIPFPVKHRPARLGEDEALAAFVHSIEVAVKAKGGDWSSVSAEKTRRVAELFREIEALPRTLPYGNDLP